MSINLEKVLDDPNSTDNILMEEYDVVNVLSIDDFDDNFNISVVLIMLFFKVNIHEKSLVFNF